ncbi:unnamed protein product [Pleuronectes platessa]|uniref:Uncharacterized protein n=1 Tax=Pleuronectes platessa TaxID=8262 RepID=A0A9N7TM97_PLEPL|nr:unnamed protein product [Pleuronectes platessa]
MAATQSRGRAGEWTPQIVALVPQRGEKFELTHPGPLLFGPKAPERRWQEPAEPQVGPHRLATRLKVSWGLQGAPQTHPGLLLASFAANYNTRLLSPMRRRHTDDKTPQFGAASLCNSWGRRLHVNTQRVDVWGRREQ